MLELLALNLAVAALGAAAAYKGRTAAAVSTLFASALLAFASYIARGVEEYSWLGVDWGILGIGFDSVSLLFMAVSVIVVSASLAYMEGNGGASGITACSLLLVHASVTGLSYAYSLPAFYIFWEMLLLSSTLLIASYRRGIALRFFVYMHAGSLMMLAGIGILSSRTGPLFGQTVPEAPATTAAAILLLLSFAVKLGVFPLHSWVPEAYTMVPPEAAAVLSGVVTGAGGYGMYRVLYGYRWPSSLESLFILFAWMGAVSAILGGMRAIGENRLGMIASYSSIGHSGYMFAGLAVGLAGAPLAAIGGVFHMVAHGVVKPLFFLVSGVLSKQSGTDDVRNMGLYARSMPFTGFAGFTASMSLAGVPAFALFPGELMLILGAASLDIAMAGALAAATLASAAYAIRFWLRVFWHPPAVAPKQLPREAGPGLLLPLLVLSTTVIILGVAPAPVVDCIRSSLEVFVP